MYVVLVCRHCQALCLAFLSLLLAAIVAKIWITRRSAASASVSLFPVIAVIVESGAIYTSSVLGLLVAFLCGSNGQYAALDIMTPLVVSIDLQLHRMGPHILQGVVYCLIVLQIHFHLRISQASRRGATSNWSVPQSWRRRTPHGEITTTDDIGVKTFPFQSGVAVHITEHAETRSDRDYRSKVRMDDEV